MYAGSCVIFSVSGVVEIQMLTYFWFSKHGTCAFDCVKMATKDEDIQVLDSGSDNVDINCEPCALRQNYKKVTACFYCTTCKQYQCSECSSMHSIFPTLEGHVVIAAERAEHGVETRLTQLETCSMHKKRYEFICEIHDVLCCSSCVVADHRLCKTITELNDTAVSAPEDIDKIKQTLQSAQNSAASLSEINDALKLDAKSQIKEKKEMFEKTKTRLEKNLEQCKHEFERNTSNWQLEIEKDVEGRQNKVEEARASATQYLGILEGASQHKTDVQNYIYLQQARRHKLPDIISVLDKQEKELYRLNLTPEKSSQLTALLDSKIRLVNVVLKKQHVGNGHLSDLKQTDQHVNTSPIVKENTYTPKRSQLITCSPNVAEERRLTKYYNLLQAPPMLQKKDIKEERCATKRSQLITCSPNVTEERRITKYYNLLHVSPILQKEKDTSITNKRDKTMRWKTIRSSAFVRELRRTKRHQVSFNDLRSLTRDRMSAHANYSK